MSFSTRRERQEQVRNPAPSSSQNMFRRSRTLTGSISSKVTAAVEQASQLRSVRLEEHDLRSHRRKLTAMLLGSLVVVGVLAWVVDETIAFLEPDSSSATTAAHIEIVERYFSGHPLERLPFMLQQQTLSSYVSKNAPEVASVSINGDDVYARHSVSVTERTPVAQWAIGTETYYVDAEGVAYQHAGKHYTGLLQVKDETGLPLASQRVASRSTMQFIGRTVAQLQAKGAGKVTEVILPAGQLKEIDITLENRPYRIKLHIDRSPEGEAGDVVATLTYLDSHGITPQYIDARVEGKAFYR